MGPGVQPKRTKLRKRLRINFVRALKQQHERCHKRKWVTGSKQKAKVCLKTRTSYQDIVSHSQRFAILRIPITSGWHESRMGTGFLFRLQGIQFSQDVFPFPRILLGHKRLLQVCVELKYVSA